LGKKGELGGRGARSAEKKGKRSKSEGKVWAAPIPFGGGEKKKLHTESGVPLGPPPLGLGEFAFLFI